VARGRALSAAAEVAIPALLRAARGVYADAIAEHLAAAGFSDVPRNGPFVLGGLARYGEAVGGLVQDLGVSKQAASQLVDTLVIRGYLDRRVHPEDRRRMVIELTERGRAAAGAIRAGVDAVDARLAARVSADDLAGMRRGLAALGELNVGRSGS
jgi:DNA-binding MarR family transcriptional regulator